MRVVFLVLIILLPFSLTGCNTVAGFGEDLEKLGGKISDKAEK